MGEQADNKIRFFCFHCFHPVSAPAEFAGRKGRCNKCGKLTRIPPMSTRERRSQRAHTEEPDPFLSTPSEHDTPVLSAITEAPRPVNGSAAPSLSVSAGAPVGHDPQPVIQPIEPDLVRIDDRLGSRSPKEIVAHAEANPATPREQPAATEPADGANHVPASPRRNLDPDKVQAWKAIFR